MALGGDAYALDLAVCGIAISFGIGAGFGARWTAGNRERWSPFFALFGIGGGLLSMFLGYVAAPMQGLYHGLGGGFLTALASLAVWTAIAFFPWSGAGIAFSRMSSGADGQILTPLAFGAAAGILILDRLLGPIIGAALVHGLSVLGILALSVGQDGSTPLLRRKKEDLLRPILFVGVTGCLLGIAGKSAFLLLLQFFAASRQEIAWIQVLFLCAVALGAVGFGNRAARSKRPMLWTWLFVGGIGVSLGASLFVAEFLQDPGNYRYYFGAFHANEGSLLQGFLLFAALGILPSLALGAALRAIADPSAEPARPSVAATAGALCFGAVLGIFLTSGSLLEAVGITSSLKISLVLLIGVGALGILLVGEAGGTEKGAGVGICVLGIVFLLPLLPYQIEARNAYAPGTLAVRERLEGPDGVALATLEPGRRTELWWNHNPASSDHPSLEKLEVAMTAMLSQGPDRALCLSSLSPSRGEKMRAAGIGTIDLCPPAPLLGEISLRLESPPTSGAALFRAPLGIARNYPLIVAFPEPLWPASVSSLWSERTFSAMSAKLTENGCFLLWLDPRACSAAALREIARSFANAFPSAEAFLAFSGFQGPSVVLVGRNRVLEKEIDSDPRTEKVLAELRANETFAGIPIARHAELARLQIADRNRILDATAGASRSWGPFERSSWDLRPQFQPEQQSEGIHFLLALATRGSSAPKGVLDPVASTRLALMGFLERLRNQPVREGWMSSLEEGGLTTPEMQRFLEALEADPSFTPVLAAWEELGARALRDGLAALAAPIFEKASAKASQHPSLKYWHGRMLLESGFAKSAIVPLQSAAESESALPARWHFLGIAHFKSGEWRGAAKSLEKAHELESGNPQTLAALALCYAELGDATRARETLEKARAIAPSDPAVQAALEKLR